MHEVKHRIWLLLHHCVSHPLMGLRCLFLGDFDDKDHSLVVKFHDFTAYRAWDQHA